MLKAKNDLFGLARRLADFRAALALVIVTRLAFVPLRVYALFHSSYYAEHRYWWWMTDFLAQGQYPYLDYWLEYPPLFPWLMAGVYKLAAFFLGGVALEAGFYTAMSLLLAAAEMGVVVLIWKLGKLLLGSEQQAARSVWFYLLCFFPGYLWAGWWDNLPVLLMLWALYLLLTGREKRSAVLVGLGMATKLFPLLLIPAAVCCLPTWRRKIAYGAVSVLTLAAGFAPFALFGPEMTRASLVNMATRPSWETVWALMDGYTSYGIVAPIPEHLDAASASKANHSSNLPWPAITAAFGLLAAVVYLRGMTWPRCGGGRQEGSVLAGFRHTQPGNPDGTAAFRRITALTAFGLCFLLVYSKGYSPQYLMWVAPLLALLLPTRRGAAVALALTVANLIELPVYITLLPDQTWLLWLAVLARTALLAGLAWVFGRMALREQAGGKVGVSWID